MPGCDDPRLDQLGKVGTIGGLGDTRAVDRQYIGVRTKRWTYAELLTNEKELYDLANDPHQLINVAGAASLVNQQAALKNLLKKLRTAKGQDCNVPVPPVLA